MNYLLHPENGYEDFVKTIEALLEESQEDHKILRRELERKETEIEEKIELISCLRGETRPTAKEPELEEESVDSAADIVEVIDEPENIEPEPMDDGSYIELENKLSERMQEIGELKSHVKFYSEKLTNLEEKASKIASLGDMTVEVLKKHIERLYEELRLREEIIAELKSKENGNAIRPKELKESRAGQPSE